MSDSDSKKSNLSSAQRGKNDEFYTQWADIEREINAYLDFDSDVFRDKVILLPCDDPEWSNFTKFFALNFVDFGIRKLISQNQSNWQSSHTTLQARTDLVSVSPAPYLIKAEQVGRSNSAQQAYDALVALHPEILSGNYKYIGIGLTPATDDAYAGYFTMDFAIDKPPPVDPGYSLDEVRELILSKTNQFRASNSLPPLQLNSDLNTVAQNWTVQMASSNTMSHNPNYSSQYPSGWTAAGENLAANVVADNVVASWINSPEHKANLLGDYTYLGVGYAKSSGGVTYYTQNFAKY